MKIELLVVPDCPNEVAADELIRTAVADTAVQAVITQTVIASQQQAQERGFVGSPTILLNGADPFALPEAPVALACRLYTTPEGLRGVPALREVRQALKRVAASEGHRGMPARAAVQAMPTLGARQSLRGNAGP